MIELVIKYQFETAKDCDEFIQLVLQEKDRTKAKLITLGANHPNPIEITGNG